MYLLALLGLLKWTSTAVQKRNSRREQEPKCVPHFLSDFVLLLFVRFLVQLSCQFCPIFCPISSPTFFSDLLLLLYVWSFVRFTGPISCSIFCPIFSANSCPIFLSDILWSFVRFLSDILSDISPYFPVRFELFSSRKRRERVWTEGLNGWCKSPFTKISSGYLWTGPKYQITIGFVMLLEDPL